MPIIQPDFWRLIASIASCLPAPDQRCNVPRGRAPVVLFGRTASESGSSRRRRTVTSPRAWLGRRCCFGLGLWSRGRRHVGLGWRRWWILRRWALGAFAGPISPGCASPRGVKVALLSDQ